MANITVLSEAELQLLTPLINEAKSTGSGYWKVYEALADLLEDKGFLLIQSTILICMQVKLRCKWCPKCMPAGHQLI